MDSHHLTPKERLVRVLGGLGLAALGCVIFAVSQARDPENRWALAGILAVIVGLSWAGPGFRGRRDGPVAREPAPPAGEPVSAERTAVGLLAAWLVPGLGHWMIGRRRKALLLFATITACFLAGLLLAQGRNLSYDRDAVYFLAYVFNAGETGLGWLVTRHLELDRPITHLHVGFLYTAVACLLNLVAMMDFVETCTRSADAAAPAAPDARPPAEDGP